MPRQLHREERVKIGLDSSVSLSTPILTPQNSHLSTSPAYHRGCRHVDKTTRREDGLLSRRSDLSGLQYSGTTPTCHFFQSGATGEALSRVLEAIFYEPSEAPCSLSIGLKNCALRQLISQTETPKPTNACAPNYSTVVLPKRCFTT